MTQLSTHSKIKHYSLLLAISAGVFALAISIVAVLTVVPSNNNLYVIGTIANLMLFIAYPALFIFGSLLIHALSKKYGETSTVQITFDILSWIAILGLTSITLSIAGIFMGSPSTPINDGGGYVLLFLLIPLGVVASTLLIITSILTLVRRRKTNIGMTAKVINVASIVTVFIYWTVLVTGFTIGTFVN